MVTPDTAVRFVRSLCSSNSRPKPNQMPRVTCYRSPSKTAVPVGRQTSRCTPRGERHAVIDFESTRSPTSSPSVGRPDRGCCVTPRVSLTANIHRQSPVCYEISTCALRHGCGRQLEPALRELTPSLLSKHNPKFSPAKLLDGGGVVLPLGPLASRVLPSSPCE